MVAGVCGGISELTGADVRVVRVIYALTGIPSLGFTLVGYFLLWLLIPAADAGRAPQGT